MLILRYISSIIYNTKIKNYILYNTKILALRYIILRILALYCIVLRYCIYIHRTKIISS